MWYQYSNVSMMFWSFASASGDGKCNQVHHVAQASHASGRDGLTGEICLVRLGSGWVSNDVKLKLKESHFSSRELKDHKERKIPRDERMLRSMKVA